MRAPLLRSSVTALALVALATRAAAANPSTVSVGTLPVSPGQASVEVPLARGFAAEGAVVVLGQGTFEDQNPFAYLAGVAPVAWLHFDAVPNLRLSASFQEVFWQEVAPLRVPSSAEERGVVRARLQQPRGTAAIYEMLQLDVRSFEDATGAHHLAWRPRLRLGQGFNLDAVRIHSLVLYQEIAFRFSNDGYYARSFEFFRAVAGYMWTTRRGTFVTVALAAQLGLNPSATAYTFMIGPALSVNYRFRARAAEAPPVPPDVEMN